MRKKEKIKTIRYSPPRSSSPPIFSYSEAVLAFPTRPAAGAGRAFTPFSATYKIRLNCSIPLRFTTQFSQELNAALFCAVIIGNKKMETARRDKKAWLRQ
jgi:hypothetical protein